MNSTRHPLACCPFKIETGTLKQPEAEGKQNRLSHEFARMNTNQEENAGQKALSNVLPICSPLSFRLLRFLSSCLFALIRG
jgi:hypothetical protein